MKQLNIHATAPLGRQSLATLCMVSALIGLSVPVAQAAPVHTGNIVYGTIVQAPKAISQAPIPHYAPTHPAPAPLARVVDSLPSAPVCSGGGVGVQRKISVLLGKSTTIALPEAVKSRTVGNPAVVQSVLISPKVLYVLGLAVGTTNMLVQGRNGACSVIDVVVGVDPSGLQQAIANLMPEETGVTIKAASGALVLTGTVSDAVKAARIVELAEQFVASANQAVATKADGRGSQAGGAVSGNKNIINMLKVAAPQQVLLEVKVAEVSKSLIEKLGANTALYGGIGNAHVGFTTQLLPDVSAAITSVAGGNKLAGQNMLGAEKTDSLVKILAEPNLMAISGQKANFLAGGKIYMPVPDGDGKITLQEQTFGVGLEFTPTVLDNGRVNLAVAPEVSELSQNGVSMSFGEGKTSWNLPMINTRRASTTIQVYDGQSFAIGGLMKNNVSGAIKSIPGLGELPLIGALFRSTEYQNDKTELVFIVTPHLVKALPKQYPLPTDSFGKVNGASVLLNGNMEGQKPSPAVVPAAPKPVVLNPPPAVSVKPTQPAAPASKPVVLPPQPAASATVAVPSAPVVAANLKPVLPTNVKPVVAANVKPVLLKPTSTVSAELAQSTKPSLATNTPHAAQENNDE